MAGYTAETLWGRPTTVTGGVSLDTELLQLVELCSGDGLEMASHLVVTLLERHHDYC